MQGTLVEDQRNKCISAILSGNGTLAQKHWVQIMKYISSPEKVEATLANLVKEAYNGVPDRIAPLASFIAETSQCSGFATLYSEMTNYGHVFGGKLSLIYGECLPDHNLILLPTIPSVFFFTEILIIKCFVVHKYSILPEMINHH